MRSTWLRSAGIIPWRLLFSAMVSPPMRISPESGTSSMLMQRSIVDLPEPEAPRIEIDVAFLRAQRYALEHFEVSEALAQIVD